MLKFSGPFLIVCLLAAVPAHAGNLSFDNGQTSWHSTQCIKPNPPVSVMHAHPETAGDDMNGLIGQHNAYVDAMQTYMNCLGDESERDQTMVDQAITANAQKAIADAQAEVDSSSAALQNSRK